MVWLTIETNYQAVHWREVVVSGSIAHGRDVPANPLVGLPAGWTPTVTRSTDLLLTEAVLAGYPDRTVSGVYFTSGASLIPQADLVSPFTVRNCRFSGNAGLHAIHLQPDQLGYPIPYVTIENCRLDGDPAKSPGADAYAAIANGNFTARRCEISGYGQGMNVGNGNVLIEECWFHDLIYVTGSAAHTECVINPGGNGVTVRRCWLQADAVGDDLGGTSAALAVYNEAGSALNGLTVVDNALTAYAFPVSYGGALTGKTGAYARNVTWTGNEVRRDLYRFGAALQTSPSGNPFWAFDCAGTGNVWSGNTWGPRGPFWAVGDPEAGTVLPCPGPG